MRWWPTDPVAAKKSPVSQLQTEKAIPQINQDEPKVRWVSSGGSVNKLTNEGGPDVASRFNWISPYVAEMGTNYNLRQHKH